MRPVARTRDGYPLESWWLDSDRFYTRARIEREPMAASKFGNVQQLTSGPNEPKPDGRAARKRAAVAEED